MFGRKDNEWDREDATIRETKQKYTDKKDARIIIKVYRRSIPSQWQ